MPATELREVPRRRSQMYKLACAPVSEATPESLLPEEVISTAAASLEDISNGGVPQISRQMYLEHLSGRNPFSAEFLQSLLMWNSKVWRYDQQ